MLLEADEVDDEDRVPLEGEEEDVEEEGLF